jgi:ketosteroid isomerase-like protein
MMTQTETENIARVKRGFEAFAAGDMATLTDLFEPHVHWHAEKTGVLEGEYKGRDALFGSFAQLGQETGGTFSAKPRTFAAAGDEVFVNIVASGKRKGRDLEQDEVLIFTLKDGHVHKVRLFVRDHAGAERFWS